jgi:hypothetical protein
MEKQTPFPGENVHLGRINVPYWLGQTAVSPNFIKCPHQK